MTEKFRQFVQIAAVHHVPGCKGVTQIVEPEVMDICSLEQVLKTPFQSLTLAGWATLRRKDPILSNHCRVPPNFFSQFRSHGDKTLLAFLQLCANRQQSFAIPHVRPTEPVNLGRAHPGRNRDQHNQSYPAIRLIEVFRSLPEDSIIQGSLQPLEFVFR
jgi:hypothetical protein